MDESGDPGWIKDLPAGWIDAFVCARRLFAKLRIECTNLDPAPWRIVVNPEYWGPHLGKAPEEYVFDEKIEARLVAMFQKAVISGQLTPSWFDGSAFKCIPLSAFSNRDFLRNALLYGGFEVDPLWPDEWQLWNGCGWAIPKEQFEHWIGREAGLPNSGLPISHRELPLRDIVPIRSRMPSGSARVALAEAVTWIAFGIGLDAERLERAIRWQKLCNGDLQAAQRQLEAAVDILLKSGADALVPMYGRHVGPDGEKGIRTEKIDPLALEDYRRALIVSEDQLHYGAGLLVWYRAINDKAIRGSERRDHFTRVTVDRQALLKHHIARITKQPRRGLSHDDVVRWCRRWIESGSGNGMDKAWNDFKSDPAHAGLSRDDVFRPAWRTAKTSA